MSIIFKQTVKTGYIEVAGLTIEFQSMLFIYPLSDKVFGLIQFLYNSGLLLIPLINFGISNVLIKYFPAVNEENKSKFYSFSFAFSVLQAIIILGIIRCFFKTHYDTYCNFGNGCTAFNRQFSICLC